MKIKGEVFITNSFEETHKLGKDFVAGRLLKQGRVLSNNVIALYGELGSGKTTFIQGLAKGLGITRRITSPTFIIIRKYKIGSRNFYHIDLYRLKTEDDIKSLGLDEIMQNEQNVVAIEWAEKLEDLLPKKRWDIRFEYLEGDGRKMTLTKLSF